MRAYNALYQTKSARVFVEAQGSRQPVMQLTTSLRVIALFDEMSDADLARVGELCTTSTYKRNAQILGEDDRTDDVFFILAGAVLINSISSKGREVIYSECTAGNIFG